MDLVLLKDYIMPNSNPHFIQEWIILDCHISNLNHGVRSRIHVNMINDLDLSSEDEVTFYALSPKPGGRQLLSMMNNESKF